MLVSVNDSLVFTASTEQVMVLTGRAAGPEFLKKLTWIAINHDHHIKQIDTVSAFHFGNQFLVEVHIVLPEKMYVKEAHDIQVCEGGRQGCVYVGVYIKIVCM